MNEAEFLNLNNELPDTEFQFKQFGEKSETFVIGLHGWTGDEHSLIPISMGVMLHNSLWIFPRHHLMRVKSQKDIPGLIENQSLNWKC